MGERTSRDNEQKIKKKGSSIKDSGGIRAVEMVQ